MSSPFRDRTDAGERLGAGLRDGGIAADVVLAIPRGGLLVGRALADGLGVPPNVVVAKKIGAPGNPEYAIGTLAADGTVWRNEAAVVSTGATEEYFDRARREAAEAARETADRYRGQPLTGTSVVLVDDGVATDSTARACLNLIRTHSPERVVLAIPVGSPETVADPETAATEIVCLETPRGSAESASFTRISGR